MVAGDEARRRPRRRAPRRRARGRASAGCRSPGCACAARRPCSGPGRRAPKTSTGPRRSSSRASGGPSSSRKKRSRSTASSSPTPNHSVRPGPSLSVEKARAPPSSTTHTGIDGEQTPVIGPTWSCSLPGSSAISPRSSTPRRVVAIARPALEQRARRPARAAAGRRRAPTRSAARSAAAARRASPGTTSPRRRDGHRARRGAPRSARTASRVGGRDRGRRARPTAASAARRASASPPAGGRQSTSTTGAPWSRSASANVDSPRLTAVDARAARVMVQSPPMPDLEALVAAVRSAPGLLGKRDLQLVERLGAGSTATTPRSSRTATGSSSSAARRSRRRSWPPTRSAPAPPRWSPTCPTCARWAAGRSRSSTCSSAPTASTPSAVLDGHRVGGGAARRAGRRRPPDARRTRRRCRPPAPASRSAPLRAPRREPGDVLLAAFALDGRYMSDDAAVLHLAARPRRREQLRDDGEALVEVAEARALPRGARRLDARRRRLAAADDRGRRLRRDARPRPRSRGPTARRSSAGC